VLDVEHFRHPHRAEFMRSSSLLITKTASFQHPVAAHGSLVLILPSPRISAPNLSLGSVVDPVADQSLRGQ
jgi:hypothetical protein